MDEEKNYLLAESAEEEISPTWPKHNLLESDENLLEKSERSSKFIQFMMRNKTRSRCKKLPPFPQYSERLDDDSENSSVCDLLSDPNDVSGAPIEFNSKPFSRDINPNVNNSMIGSCSNIQLDQNSPIRSKYESVNEPDFQYGSNIGNMDEHNLMENSYCDEKKCLIESDDESLAKTLIQMNNHQKGIANSSNMINASKIENANKNFNFDEKTAKTKSKDLQYKNSNISGIQTDKSESKRHTKIHGNRKNKNVNRNEIYNGNSVQSSGLKRNNNKAYPDTILNVHEPSLKSSKMPNLVNSDIQMKCLKKSKRVSWSLDADEVAYDVGTSTQSKNQVNGRLHNHSNPHDRKNDDTDQIDRSNQQNKIYQVDKANQNEQTIQISELLQNDTPLVTKNKAKKRRKNTDCSLINRIDDIVRTKINKNHKYHGNIVKKDPSNIADCDDLLLATESGNNDPTSHYTEIKSETDSDDLDISEVSASSVCSCHQLIDMQSIMELAYEEIDPKKMTRAERFGRWIQLSGPCEMFFFGIVVAFSAFHIALNRMTRERSTELLIALVFQCIVLVLSCIEAGLRVTLLWDFLPRRIRSSKFLMIFYLFMCIIALAAASIMIHKFYNVKFVGMAAGLFSLPIGFLYFTVFLKSARKLIIYGNKPLIKFPM